MPTPLSRSQPPPPEASVPATTAASSAPAAAAAPFQGRCSVQLFPAAPLHRSSNNGSCGSSASSDEDDPAADRRISNNSNGSCSYGHNAASTRYQHLYVLPVLLLEFLALALTRAVLPALLLDRYGSDRVYVVLGCAELVRGMLAFAACPAFGRLSDLWGSRRGCLFLTVLGTCAPVCALALFPWSAEHPSSSSADNSYADLSDAAGGIPGDDGADSASLWSFVPDWFSSTTSELHPSQQQEQQQQQQSGENSSNSSSMAIPVFVVLLALSGMFASTFTLVFAYISDTVPVQEERVAAYGLALATFGLSFTVGPMLGTCIRFLSPHTHTHTLFPSSRHVFTICSLVD
jgi:MFS family permease